MLLRDILINMKVNKINFQTELFSFKLYIPLYNVLIAPSVYISHLLSDSNSRHCGCSLKLAEIGS